MKRLKPLRINRKTLDEVRYHPKMGSLNTQVTKIQKTFLGFPIKTLHEYRSTYHGRIKDCNECKLSNI